MRDVAPGQLECDAAVLALTAAVSAIEDAHMVATFLPSPLAVATFLLRSHCMLALCSLLFSLQSATVGTLAPCSDSNVQGFQVSSLDKPFSPLDI